MVLLILVHDTVHYRESLIPVGLPNESYGDATSDYINNVRGSGGGFYYSNWVDLYETYDEDRDKKGNLKWEDLNDDIDKNYENLYQTGFAAVDRNTGEPKLTTDIYKGLNTEQKIIVTRILGRYLAATGDKKAVLYEDLINKMKDDKVLLNDKNGQEALEMLAKGSGLFETNFAANARQEIAARESKPEEEVTEEEIQDYEDEIKEGAKKEKKVERIYKMGQEDIKENYKELCLAKTPW